MLPRISMIRAFLLLCRISLYTALQFAYLLIC